MKQFTTKEIEAQFEKLPKELQDAVTSPDAQAKVQDIAKKHNLRVDQLGELVDEIGMIMLGLEKSSNFVGQTSERLGISVDEARSIGADVNKDIFSAIKTHLREMEEKRVAEEMGMHAETKEQDIKNLEKLGQFDVERDKPENKIDVTSADKQEILQGIENPPPAIPRGVTQANHTEPMVDYLLANPVANQQEVIKKAPTPPAQPTKPDPYKEPIK